MKRFQEFVQSGKSARQFIETQTSGSIASELPTGGINKDDELEESYVEGDPTAPFEEESFQEFPTL